MTTSREQKLMTQIESLTAALAHERGKNSDLQAENEHLRDEMQEFRQAVRDVYSHADTDPALADYMDYQEESQP